MAIRNILVCGNFNILHPGHIRLLKFARDCGDYLSVAVMADSVMAVVSRVPESQRLELIKLLDFVDEAFITTDTPAMLISKLKPWAVIKGKEFENQSNCEESALEEYGGRLIFGSGEFGFDSGYGFQIPATKWNHFEYSELKDYAVRHQITLDYLSVYFVEIKKLRVAVIGEVIVDEYIHGTAVGLSQEDPTIVMTPIRNERFLGGAAITAGHTKSLTNNYVCLYSVLGCDAEAIFSEQQSITYNLTPYFFKDITRPTILKTRYRIGNKTLLRVNRLRQHSVSNNIQNLILSNFRGKIKELDLVIFSDFNYGLLTQNLVDSITKLCLENNVKIIADSQTSSQIGDISRYKSALLITPTEREVRVALNNSDDGLVILANKLCEISAPKSLAITLGEEGVFIHIPTADGLTWDNDKIPALNKNAIDPAGAGDCFLASSGLFLAAGASPWAAFYVGSIAAACQVDTLGNSPLQIDQLIDAVTASFQ